MIHRFSKVTIELVKQKEYTKETDGRQNLYTKINEK